MSAMSGFNRLAAGTPIPWGAQSYGEMANLLPFCSPPVETRSLHDWYACAVASSRKFLLAAFSRLPLCLHLWLWCLLN